jgi:uncharacterized repeat protein (TIGR03803 family)
MGNIYGTTSIGGEFNMGTVFRLDVGSSVPRTLWSFQGSDGHAPVGDLIVDALGNLYGVTAVGGEHDDGTVFRLSDVEWGVPEPASAWLMGMAMLGGWRRRAK